MGIPNEMEYRDMYSEITGKDLSANWEFYMAFSLFKVGAICQAFLVGLEMELHQASMLKTEE